MQIITPAQCRAARALLNWSQPDLAKRCDIHVQTISNFEKETSTPTKKTLLNITQVFESADIEFNEHDGVKRKIDIIKKYIGREGFRAFMDDIYLTAKETGGEICLLNANPNLWIEWLGHDWYYNVHVPRMEKLLPKFNLRITIQKNNYNFIGNRFGEYRWIPDRIWNQNSFYSYGNKIGFMNFESKNLDIFVLDQRKFSETFRFLFNLVWDQYSIIPDTDDYKPKTKK